MAQQIGWKECFTLSGQAKHFCWIFGFSEPVLRIKRKLKGLPKREQKEITWDQLNKIHNYVRDHPGTGLGNSVSVKDEEGIGKFMEREFGWDSTDAQLASHIAALFVDSDAWLSNGAKRGIKLWINSDESNWQERLKTLYGKSSNCD